MKRKILISAAVLFLGFFIWNISQSPKFKSWLHYNVRVKLMTSSKSANVEVLPDAINITSLSRTRTLRIYKPFDYDSSTERYPVIYMLDAGRLFDNKTTGTRGEEGIDEILDEAIAKGGQKVLVVAIDASEQRSRELNPYNEKNVQNNESIKFMEYIVNELKSKIDTEYRTLPDREHTAIIGASLGGLFANYVLMHHSDKFSMAGALSPSFQYSDEFLELPDQMTNSNAKLYLNVGSHEWQTMIDNVNRLEKALSESSLSGLKCRKKIVEDGGHHPMVWADGFKECYAWFFE